MYFRNETALEVFVETLKNSLMMRIVEVLQNSVNKMVISDNKAQVNIVHVIPLGHQFVLQI